MRLIGLSGTNGAGKDLVGEILAKEHGYMFISVTDLLRVECAARNLPVERENLRVISSEWRKQGGLGVLVDKAVETYRNTPQTYRGLVVSSLRNDGEVDSVHTLNGTVLWIDADPKIRFARISAGRGRSEDNKTYEQFLAEQEAEMQGNPNDPTSLNMSVVKEKSDLTILNEGSDITVFANDLVNILRPFSLV